MLSLNMLSDRNSTVGPARVEVRTVSNTINGATLYGVRIRITVDGPLTGGERTYDFVMPDAGADPDAALAAIAAFNVLIAEHRPYSAEHGTGPREE